MFNEYLKKWIFLFVLLLFSLIIAIRTNIWFFNFFFWVLLSVVVLSVGWLILGYVTTSMSMVRKVADKVYEDDFLELQLTISSRGIIPLVNVVLEDYLPCAPPDLRKKIVLLDFLGIRGEVTLDYNCLCELRGKYNLGPITIFFFDPLGLFFLKHKFSVFSEVWVYPRPVEVRKFPPLTKGILPWFGVDSARKAGGDDEFFGTREYRQGDPRKYIHWLSSARKNTLIVKEFQDRSYYKATLVFNLSEADNAGEGKESVVEYTIKIAASVAKYCYEKNIPLEILAHTGELVHIPSNKGEEHLEDILKFLAVAQPESKVSLSEMFVEFSPYIDNDANLITIMLDRDFEYLRGVFALSKRSVSVIPMVIIYSSFLDNYDVATAERAAALRFSSETNSKPLIFFKGCNMKAIFTT